MGRTSAIIGWIWVSLSHQDTGRANIQDHFFFFFKSQPRQVMVRKPDQNLPSGKF